MPLPAVNASLNGASAVLLTAGWLCIRRRRVAAHRACMVAAFVISIAFLAGYLYYHATAGIKHFAGHGVVRAFYFALLTSHTMLAAAVPVLAVITLRRALGGDFARHQAIARWTLPIWWYVSATGVLVYFMLYRMGPG